MPYSINKTNGDLLATVADGTIDQTTSLKLVGKNYAGYGEIQNENFVRLLENFADITQPSKKITGQIWYDSSASPGKLRFWDGTSFRSINGSTVATSEPSGLGIGDFYWDSIKQQLYVWSGDEYTLVGPQSSANLGITEMRTKLVFDDLPSPTEYTIIEAVVAGIVVYVISSEDFELSTADKELYGNTFTHIYKGLTLINSGGSNGIPEDASEYRYHGTATAADGLIIAGDFVDGVNFVRTDGFDQSFDNLIGFYNDGFQIGNPPKLEVKITSDIPLIQNIDGTRIQFKTKLSGIMVGAVEISGKDLLPLADNVSTLGNTSYKFKEVWSTNFYGTVTQSDRLQVDGSAYRLADTADTPNTVAARD